MISRILSGLIRRHSTRRRRHAEHNVRPIHDWVCNGTHRLSDDDRGPIRPNRLALVVKTAALIAMPVTALTYPKKRHAAPGEADPSHCRCGCSRIKLKKSKKCSQPHAPLGIFLGVDEHRYRADKKLPPIILC